MVTDVLRAATSMIWALEAGAAEIIPVHAVEEARKIAAERSDCLLAGERNCLPIDGFDFGNSPRSFPAAKATGRTLVMTTTNGTAALLHCQRAARVLVGAFANLAAVGRRLVGKSFHVVCAGTDGRETEEDLLFAGALVAYTEELNRKNQHSIRWLGEAGRAHELWQKLGRDPGALENALRNSRGGRNLLAVGLEHDLADAAMIDCSQLVPEYFPSERIVR